MAFVILAGNFDMSVGGIVGLTSVVIIYLFKINLPIYLVVIFSLLLGLLIGIFNGTITVFARINSIISTLGTLSILTGTASIISTNIKTEIVLNENFNKIGRGFIGGVFPIIFLYTIIAFIIAALVLKYTHFGRNLYAVGGSKEISRIVGIKTKKIQFITFVISGCMSSLAAVLLVSRLGSGRPEFGQTLTIESITICVLGGIVLGGGKGDLLGVFVALLFLNSITNGLVMLDVPIYLRYVFSGVLLVVAIILNQMRYGSRRLY